MGQLVARLVRIYGPSENQITYADAVAVLNGIVLRGPGLTGWAGIGWCGGGDTSDPDGKFEALWCLAQTLSRAGVEVE